MSYNPRNPNGQATMANSEPVVIASDQTPINVTVQATISGGATVFHLVSAGTTNATVVKNTAAKLVGYYLFNSNTLPRKIAFHNSATLPVAGAGILFTIVLPGLAGANVALPTGIDFSAGLAITTTADIPDAGTTPVALNDLVINLFYK